jgi:hypothetical protein
MGSRYAFGLLSHIGQIWLMLSVTCSIVVEFAKESRPRREPYDGDRTYAPRTRRPGGVRLLVQGISRDTSWQVSYFIFYVFAVVALENF